MKNTLVIAMCALVGLVAVVGCTSASPATPHSLRATKGTGLIRVYEAPPTAVWSTVLTVLSDLKLKCIDENRHERYLLAESDLAIVGKGELVVVFIEPQTHTRNTRVEVISKKVNLPGLFAPAERNWAVDILDQLDGHLKGPTTHPRGSSHGDGVVK